MRHLVIPDTQVKPGEPTEHLRWAGLYAAKKKPDVIVHIGDHFDMPSLSSWDVGKKSFEGRRYLDDIEAGIAGMELFLQPIREEQERLIRNRDKRWNPRMIFTLGNHENRINRAVANSPILDGVISVKDLDYERDWEVHDFLRPVFIGGVGFSHYWPVGAMGRPASSASAIVGKLHQSCVAGHQQGKQVAYGKRADGTAICAIIAGSFYLHDEDYMDALSNAHWRGLVVLNEVKDGAFDEMFLSMNYLEKKYAINNT